MTIAKIGYGKGSQGLLKYLEEGHKGQNLDRATWDHNLLGDNQKDWVQELHARASLNSRISKPYMHTSLSFDPKDIKQANLTDEQMFDFSREYLEKMGFNDHLYVMAVHRDTEHAHVHIVANRINSEGKALATSNDRFRSMDHLRGMEQERGFSSPERKQDMKINRADLERASRGEMNWKVEMQSRIDQAITLGQQKDIAGLQETLKGYGVDMKISSNGKGISYRMLTDEKEPVIFKASKLGKPYQFANIDKRVQEQATKLTEIRADLGEDLKENGFRFAEDKALVHQVIEEKNIAPGSTKKPFSVQEELKARIDDSLANTRDFNIHSFLNHLEHEKGIQCKLSGNGLSYSFPTYHGQWTKVKSSSLGKDYQLKGLETRLNDLYSKQSERYDSLFEIGESNVRKRTGQVESNNLAEVGRGENSNSLRRDREASRAGGLPDGPEFSEFGGDFGSESGGFRGPSIGDEDYSPVNENLHDPNGWQGGRFDDDNQGIHQSIDEDFFAARAASEDEFSAFQDITEPSRAFTDLANSASSNRWARKTLKTLGQERDVNRPRTSKRAKALFPKQVGKAAVLKTIEKSCPELKPVFQALHAVQMAKGAAKMLAELSSGSITGAAFLSRAATLAISEAHPAANLATTAFKAFNMFSKASKSPAFEVAAKSAESLAINTAEVTEAASGLSMVANAVPVLGEAKMVVTAGLTLSNMLGKTQEIGHEISNEMEL